MNSNLETSKPTLPIGLRRAPFGSEPQGRRQSSRNWKPDFGETAIGNPRRLANHRHSAFTLLELLVVIGIILILIGMFFAGAKIVTGQAQARDTRTALETCKTMLANYQQATHFGRTPPAGVLVNNLSNPLIIPTTPQFWTAGQEPAPTTALSSDPSSYSNTSGLLPGQSMAFVNTVLAMEAIESVQENKTIITNLPSAKILNVYLPGGVIVPLIRDGYGNPILFVPGGGLGVSTGAATPGVVWLDGTNFGLITSSGIINSSSLKSPTLNAYDAGDPNIFPNGASTQPFFVSAGPDGDISNNHGDLNYKPTSDKTDDNIYSFNN
jgi:prepilin-type N-terminal cleavage/methylation domain-containing protein